jgi:hypothetical protein
MQTDTTKLCSFAAYTVLRKYSMPTPSSPCGKGENC